MVTQRRRSQEMPHIVAAGDMIHLPSKGIVVFRSGKGICTSKAPHHPARTGNQISGTNIDSIVLREALPTLAHHLVEVIGKIGSSDHGQWKRAPKTAVDLQQDPAPDPRVHSELDHCHAGVFQRSNQPTGSVQEFGIERDAFPICAAESHCFVNPEMLEGDEDSSPFREDFHPDSAAWNIVLNQSSVCALRYLPYLL